MDYILQSKEVCKDFSGRMAVDHVSIGVKKGDIYGFIGENGAGKTTFMRMVCGLAAPTGGEIKLFGSGDLPAQRRKMGSLIENPALFPDMTAMENMETQRLLLGVEDKKACAEILDMAGIGNTGKMKAKNFSLGMKQRLMIALSLLGKPEFLVLDEPTNGLDPMGIKEVRDFLQRLNESRGLTILISSHILGELEKLATRYGIISKGKMVDEFLADELPSRCGKVLEIHTNDPHKTEKVISEMYNGLTCERSSENSVRMVGHVEEAGKINRILVEAGIVVNALIPQGENLEDYLLRLIGGKVHA